MSEGSIFHSSPDTPGSRLSAKVTLSVGTSRDRYGTVNAGCRRSGVWGRQTSSVNAQGVDLYPQGYPRFGIASSPHHTQLSFSARSTLTLASTALLLRDLTVLAPPPCHRTSAPALRQGLRLFFRGRQDRGRAHHSPQVAKTVCTLASQGRNSRLGRVTGGLHWLERCKDEVVIT